MIGWAAWVRPDVPSEADEMAAARARAIQLADQTLEKTASWLDQLPNGPDFDRWMTGIRNELRPCFRIFSLEFDNQLLFIIREFDEHNNEVGPLRNDDRKVALVSIRSLLKEERARLDNPSLGREERDKRLIRLPPSVFQDGW